MRADILRVYFVGIISPSFGITCITDDRGRKIVHCKVFGYLGISILNDALDVMWRIIFLGS